MLPVVSLQQTIPPGGISVCPLSTVQYTCVAQNELEWRESDSVDTAMYASAVSRVNDTAMSGSFRTVLTDINGDMGQLL